MKLRLIEPPPFSITPTYKPGDCWYARDGGHACKVCGCLWRDNAPHPSVSLFDASQVPAVCCDNRPEWDFEHDTRQVWYWWGEPHSRTVKPAGNEYAEIAPEHAGVRPMIVVLPGGGTFCLQSPTWQGGKPGPSGWKVSGTLPNVTVSPSIDHAAGSASAWHGHITDGVFR